LVLAISIGVLPNLSQPAQEQISAPVPAATSSEAPDPGSEQASQLDSSATPDLLDSDETLESDASLDVQGEVDSSEVTASLAGSSGDDTAEVVAAAVFIQQPEQVEDAGASEQTVLRQFFLEGVGSSLLTLGSGAPQGYSSVLSTSTANKGFAQIADLPGSSAFFDFDFDSSQVIQNFVVQINSGDMAYAAVPDLYHSVASRTSYGTVINFIATDFAFADLSGVYQGVYGTADTLRTAVITMEVRLFDSGQQSEVTLKIEQRS
jgi:hypothetical protein